MTVCSQQSVQLHRESAENLHRTVDANVKVQSVLMDTLSRKTGLKVYGEKFTFCQQKRGSLQFITLLLSSLMQILYTSIAVHPL